MTIGVFTFSAEAHWKEVVIETDKCRERHPAAINHNIQPHIRLNQLNHIQFLQVMASDEEETPLLSSGFNSPTTVNCVAC